MNELKTESLPGLPESVTEIRVGEKDIWLVGTAHVSAKSVEDVHAAVRAVLPDAVAVELCEPRFQTMLDGNAWKKTDIFQVVRKKKAAFLLAQLALQAFYRKVGKSLEVEPGADMKAAIEDARRDNLPIFPVDRRIDVTLKRIWGSLSFFAKCRLLYMGLASVFSSDDEQPSADDIETLKNRDVFSTALEEMDKSFPGLKSRLIDERDVYLAQKLREVPAARVVAVVGAGHVPGILRAIRADSDLAPLDVLPPKSVFAKVLPWLIPLLVVGLIAAGFFVGDRSTGVDSVLIWIAVNVCCTALGALLVLAHPLAVFVGALVSPLTSLNPFIAAGWVAGLVQAWIRPPKVEDFESLPSALDSFRSFFFHPIVRVLLVVIAANIGSSLGTFAAIPWIIARFGGAP